MTQNIKRFIFITYFAINGYACEYKDFIRAIIAGANDAVEVCITAGISVNDQGTGIPYTPLMFASIYGHADVVKTLLEMGEADPGARCTSKEHQNWTALMFASASENLNKYVIDSLVNANPSSVNDKNNDGHTPLMLLVNNTLANKETLLAVLGFFIKKGANIEEKDKNQQTAFMIASNAGNIDVLKVLIKEAKVVDINLKDLNNETALMLASKHNSDEHYQVIKFLIENGADVNVQDNEDNTPLLNAIQTNNLKIVKLLLENGAKVNVRNRDGVYPVIKSSQIGDYEITQELIKAGANLNVKDFNYNTPLMTAVENSNNKLIDLLVNKNVINVVDVKKESPLIKAVKAGNIEAIKTLMKYKNLDLNVRDANNQTALNIALKKIENIKKDKYTKPTSEYLTEREMVYSHIADLLVSTGVYSNISSSTNWNILKDSQSLNKDEISEKMTKQYLKNSDR